MMANKLFSKLFSLVIFQAVVYRVNHVIKLKVQKLFGNEVIQFFALCHQKCFFGNKVIKFFAKKKIEPDGVKEFWKMLRMTYFLPFRRGTVQKFAGRRNKCLEVRQEKINTSAFVGRTGT